MIAYLRSSFFLLGIMCMDRLDDIVKLVGSNAVGKKEGHLVVQKYIGNDRNE